MEENQDIIKEYPYLLIDEGTKLIKIKSDWVDYLKRLFEHHSRVVYARITPLSIAPSSEPIGLIGEITDGSINIDGKSTARRTCNLSLTTTNMESINESDWALKNKFKLEIGLEPIENKERYKAGGKPIWFPMGEFYINSFNASLNTNSLNISIGGQDKMAMLNGELGGHLPAEIVLSEYQQLNEKGEVVKTELLTLQQIIRTLLTTYGGEKEENIIINLDETGKNLLEYRGKTPMYVLINDEHKAVNITFYGKQKCYVDNKETTLENLPSYYYNKTSTGTEFTLAEDDGSNTYYCQKVEYGETAGYEEVPLTYAGELTVNAGETITSPLDKIKNMFPSFEYYYDIFGRFIFKKKDSSLEVKYPDNNNGVIKIDVKYPKTVSYTFEDLKLQSSFNNTPAIKQVKNDYTIWGTRKTTSGEFPFHARFAIEKKPKKYVSPYSKEIYSTTTKDVDLSAKIVDWREVLYQMAKDYMEHGPDTGLSEDKVDKNFKANLAKDNPQYPDGITGYEDFYLDMYTFWRELYTPGESITEYIQTRRNESPTGDYYRYELIEKTKNNDDAWPEEYGITWDKAYVQVTKDGKSYYTPWVESFDFGADDRDLYIYERGASVNLNNKVDLSTGGVWVKKEEIYKPIYLAYPPTTQDEVSRLYYSTPESKSGKKALASLYQIVNYDLAKKDLISVVNNVIVYSKKSSETRELKVVTKIEAKGETLYPDEEVNFLTALDNIQKALSDRSILTLTITGEQDTITYSASDAYLQYYQLPTEQPINRIIYRLNETGNYEYYADYLAKKEGFQKKTLYYAQEKEEKDGDGKVTTIISYINALSNVGIDQKNIYYLQVDEATQQSSLVLYDYKTKFNEVNACYILSSKLTKVDTTSLTEKYAACNWLGEITNIYETPIDYYYLKETYKSGWNTDLIKAPYDKRFWIDFIEPTEDKSSTVWYNDYSRRVIGKRTKAVNDSSVTAIDYKTTPSVEFNSGDYSLPEVYKDYFVLSAQGKTAMESFAEFMYNDTYVAATVSTNCLPIYTLEPNQVIRIKDSNTNTDDYYTINSLSIPLKFSGQMSLNLTKIEDYKTE